jgi:hypothetical protein
MIFRKSDGTLIEINRYEFKNDKIYYQKIMDCIKDIEKNTNISDISVVSLVSDNTIDRKEQKKEKK